MTENTTKKYLDFTGLSAYDVKIKEFAQAIANKIKTDIIDGAPEAYDTLKEISTYIASHKDEYEALTALVGDKAAQSDLTAAVTRIVTLETSVSTNTTEITTLKTKVENLEANAIEAITIEEINSLFETAE